MWFRVNKSANVLAAAPYRSFKPTLREEGRYQCVYCAIGESLFGGERNYHVEHYRPKSKFKNLTDTFSNLFYSCAICNSFKGSDWPAEPTFDLSNSSYPDPSIVDYASFLSVNDQGVVGSQVRAGKYVVERLNLNRAQLILARRSVVLRGHIVSLITEVERLAAACVDVDAMRDSISCLTEAVKVIDAFTKAIPYEPEDARR